MEQSISRIASGVWCINEFSLVNAFLVEGEKASALIDTGCGYGNIRKVAAAASSAPLIVLLTHKHPDHAGGIYHFRDCPIYLNAEDENLTFLGMGLGNEFRRMYAKTRGPVKCPGMEQELLTMIPEPEPDCAFPFINADDGTLIDLGGSVLECIHTPGHTAGSVCYLDKGRRILFSGDTINRSIILMRQPDNGNALIEEFLRTLRKVWAAEAAFDVLAIGHDGPFIDKRIIHDYMLLAEGILEGAVCGAYEEKGFRKGDVARYGMAELWYRCDQ